MHVLAVLKVRLHKHMFMHGLLKYMDSALILTVYLRSVTFSVQHRKEKK